MELNADFNQPVTVRDIENDWRASPSAGVERKMLDRIGGEVARATTIVRFAKGSAFAPHTHGGGEEFVVLDGVFQDEHADYPSGSYVRNPPTSRHTPRSDPGCTIFVKLWQFHPEDRQHVVIDMNALELKDVSDRPGIRQGLLYENGYERVQKENWTAGASSPLQTEGGVEILVLKGSVSDGSISYTERDWLRYPDGAQIQLTAGAEGATLWVKSGHLVHARAPAG